jgi:hypothetical protein
MHDDRIDLRPIDSLADAARYEALVAAIGAAAGPELARRTSGGLLATLGAWAWPTLAAASLAAAVSAGALLSSRTAPAEPSVASAVVEALDVNTPVALWLDGNRGPTTADLVLALEGEGR